MGRVCHWSATTTHAIPRNSTPSALSADEENLRGILAVLDNGGSIRRRSEGIGAQLRHSREVASALVRELGDAPEDRTADLNIELMHSMILRLVTATNDEGDGQPVTFGPEDVMFLTRSLQALAGAKKTNAETVLKVRQETAKEAAKAVDAAAAKVGAGLTRDTIDTIKREILGIAA